MPKIKEVTYDEAQLVISEFKAWAAGTQINWAQKSDRYFPKSYSSKNPLMIDGLLPEGLVLELYFKPSILTGVQDTFSASLLFQGVRILGLDAGQPAHHLNLVGENEEMYLREVNPPHLHRCVPDAMTGYAEPLPDASIEDLWEDFLLHANIMDAPELNLPDSGQTRPLL
ncbi:hypothetical protein [Marinospirillum sp.]|uniref:hypothetical protein n=1 Tax=Marinospirillum sp. TaxID=2183934 RepID=UPI0028704221|nr:hypothetical protein [Marinospirillum sp.]MDR9468601.1 hypothetical protein [Marinospirillum sp.]